MKERLDLLLVKRGIAPSREKAKTMIMEGCVFVNHQREDKAGSMFAEDCDIEIHGNSLKYVSRGGLKLEKAMTQFQISLQDKICMDIGASTGGFTDCMLQNGAKKVYAVDVGECAFDESLKSNPRVVVKDRINARYITPDDLGELCDFASIDVSFISLKYILPSVNALLKVGGDVIALIKPQFEAGAKELSKKGIVLSEKTHIKVCEDIKTFALELGFDVIGLTTAPIKSDKNKEFLIYLCKSIE